MITIRRVGYAAAVICWLAAAYIVLTLPQRASAQADGADAASSAPAGSRLHVEPSREAAAAPELVPVASNAVSEPGRAIHADMGRAARSARKPAASVQPATAAAFKPPGKKPPAEQVEQPAQARPGPADGSQEPAAEQTAATHPPPDGLQPPGMGPAPFPADPPSAEEAMAAARLPEVPAGEMKDSDPQAAPAPDSTRQGAIASLVFAPNSASLSGDAEGVLKDLAARFPANDEAMRLQLMAYASGEDMSASKARRLSLARALAVRSYLIANGIDGTRMDVRALGDRMLDSAVGSPTDRVDIAMIRR